MKSLKETYQKICSKTTNKNLSSRIVTLGIVPDLTCDRGCSYCYEKHKNYGEEMDNASFLSLISKISTDLKGLEEVVIDYNYRKTSRYVEEIIAIVPKHLRILATTTPSSIGVLDKVDRASLSLSIHDNSDIERCLELKRDVKSKIKYMSVMLNDAVNSMKLFLACWKLRTELRVPMYLCVDKYGKDWPVGKNKNSASELLKLSRGHDSELDNCLMTMLNNQECPAWTQLNLYKDGTVRRCPYASDDELDVDDSVFKQGCYLDRKNRR